MWAAVESVSDVDVVELKRKFTPYGFTIARAVLASPSYLFALCFFAPSRYESKLWDLKMYLAKGKPESDHVKKEFERLKEAYSMCQSAQFKKFMNVLFEDKDQVKHIAALDKKYMYFTSAAIDWELIRIQPLRYVWNQTDQIALYGLAVTAALGVNSILTKGVRDVPAHAQSKQAQDAPLEAQNKLVTDASVKTQRKLEAIQHVTKRFQRMDTVAALLKTRDDVRAFHDRLMSQDQSGRVLSLYRAIVLRIPRRIPYWLLLFNVGNLYFITKKYRMPPKKD
jgi:hypothetical protein